jgi:signal transduction histidine kinase
VRRASVRVRVTLVAVVVTGVALAAGGWGLVRSVERTKLAQVARASEDRVDAIAAQLEQGVPPGQLALGGPGAGSALVQVLRDGDVVTSSPNRYFEQPLVVSGSSDLTRTVGVASGPVLVATGIEGGGVYEVHGSTDPALPLRISYRMVPTTAGNLTVVAGSPLDEVRRAIDETRRAAWFGVPVITLLVGAVAWAVTGRALRPVEAIRAEVEAISHSTLHRRVPTRGPDDEVGRLARTMNDMLDRLEGAAERQQQFVADASHELRSPAASIRTQLEVALRADDEAALRSAAEGALAEEARLEELLADLLLLASVDEEGSVPDERVDLGAIALAAAAPPRRVPVTVSGEGSARGSARQLGRAITNLVDNGARHAAAQVTVTVAGGRITVEDDGPGIREADRERVFERFTRLDASRSRDAGGGGLGLSIVRAVVTRHGGRVGVESSPTGGARLVVELPPA